MATPTAPVLSIRRRRPMVGRPFGASAATTVYFADSGNSPDLASWASAWIDGDSVGSAASGLSRAILGDSGADAEAWLSSALNTETSVDSGAAASASVLLAVAGEAGDAPDAASWASSLFLGESAGAVASGLSRAILGDSGAVPEAWIATVSSAASAQSYDAGSGAEGWWVSSPIEYFRFEPFAARVIVVEAMVADAFVIDPFKARVIP